MGKDKTVLKYIKGTIYLPLRLTAGDMTVINWYIDGEFSVHDDMRSHSGATMIIGKGSVYSGSSKQKLNVRISTEEEIVAVDDYMTPVIRDDMFMREQGYKLRILLHQDNMSSISLEKMHSCQLVNVLDILIFVISSLQIDIKKVRLKFRIHQHMN